VYSMSQRSARMQSMVESWSKFGQLGEQRFAVFLGAPFAVGYTGCTCGTSGRNGQDSDHLNWQAEHRPCH